MPYGGLRVELTRDDDLALAVVRGEIDLDSSAQLNTVLNKVEKEERILLDMSEVSFMDSSGLAVLLRQSMGRREVGGALRIRNPSEPVRRLLEFCCLEHLLEGQHESEFEGESEPDSESERDSESETVVEAETQSESDVQS